MRFKMNFHEYKECKAKLANMSQNELSRWINTIYEHGFRDGCEQCKTESVELDALKKVIINTKGIGPVLHSRICATINNFCTESEIDNEANKDS